MAQNVSDGVNVPSASGLSNSGTAAGSSASDGPLIRNIIQSHTERPIIKTAPDFIVFIEDSPYLLNEYVGDPFTVVNINDYVIAANGSVDLEALIPSASVSLSVPNHLKYLFFAPGGNRLLQTMADIKIFGKGYFFSPNGETVYHRVFWGLISSTTYTDNGSTLDIEISCQGVLRMLELAQTNVQPAAMSIGEASGNVNGYVSKWPNMNPYEQIALAFVEQLRMDSLNRSTVETNGQISGAQKLAIQDNYVVKWTNKLKSLKQCLHLFPLSESWIDKLAYEDSTTQGSPKTSDPDFLSEIGKRYSKRSEVQNFLEQSYFEISHIHGWHGDFAVGNVQLVQSRIVSKLERARQWVEVIGYEGYQDLDGGIVFKPPLYNLDVCNTGSKLLDIENPFVVHLDEIESEQESEDERAIRATRIQVCGNVSSLVDLATEISQGYATYADMKLIRKFGLREDGMRKIAFLGPDSKSNFSYAVAEMAKLNRQFRTYQCTIPFRPELKLGFPAYFPHMDMYGYIRSLSWSYNVGGTASMTLHCDQIRRRVMYNLPVTNSDGSTAGFKFQSVPYLVTKWMEPATTAKTATQARNLEKQIAEKGTVASLSPSAGAMPSDRQYKVLSYLTDDVKSLYSTAPDKPTYSWNVIADPADIYFGSVSDSNTVRCDDDYLEYIRTTQPFTDGKGYEVISPMLWGRGQTLISAINAFTKNDSQAKNDEIQQGGTTQSRVAAFLFSAAGNIITKSGSSLDASLTRLDEILKPVVENIKGNDDVTKGPIVPPATFFVLRYQDTSAGTSPSQPASNNGVQGTFNDIGQQLSNMGNGI